jgi:hypothetical protein
VRWSATYSFGLVGGGLGGEMSRFGVQNQQKSTKFVTDFEEFVLILKWLDGICTSSGAGKSLLRSFCFSGR